MMISVELTLTGEETSVPVDSMTGWTTVENLLLECSLVAANSRIFLPNMTRQDFEMVWKLAQSREALDVFALPHADFFRATVLANYLHIRHLLQQLVPCIGARILQADDLKYYRPLQGILENQAIFFLHRVNCAVLCKRIKDLSERTDADRVGFVTSHFDAVEACMEKYDKEWPIVYAVQAGKLELVNMLLPLMLIRHPLSLDIAIEKAIEHKQAEIFSTLQRYDLRVGNEKFAEHLIAASKYGNTDVAANLLQRIPFDSKTLSLALGNAVERGHSNVVRLLLENKTIRISEDRSNACFRRTIAIGATEIFQMLLSDKRFDPTRHFIYACQQGRTEMVELLLASERLDLRQESSTFIAEHIQTLTWDILDVLCKDDRFDSRTSAVFIINRALQAKREPTLRLMFSHPLNGLENQQHAASICCNSFDYIDMLPFVLREATSLISDDLRFPFTITRHNLATILVLVDDGRADPSVYGNKLLRDAIAADMPDLVQKLLKDERVLAKMTPEIRKSIGNTKRQRDE